MECRWGEGGRFRGILPREFLKIYSLVHSGVCFVTMMIMAYSFKKLLSEIANYRIINVNNCVFSTDGVWNYAFLVKILENVHGFSHFDIILKYVIMVL